MRGGAWGKEHVRCQRKVRSQGPWESHCLRNPKGCRPTEFAAAGSRMVSKGHDGVKAQDYHHPRSGKPPPLTLLSPRKHGFSCIVQPASLEATSL
jgi:hypothetical protein